MSLGKMLKGRDHPCTVTDENLEKIQKDFQTKLEIGDIVEWFQYGGALSSRAGEQVLREGEVIEKNCG